MLTDDHKHRELLWETLWLDAHSGAASGKQDKRGVDWNFWLGTWNVVTHFCNAGDKNSAHLTL